MTTSIEGHREGGTFDRARDTGRLNRQARAVFNVMKDGKWRTLKTIALLTNEPEASVPPGFEISASRASAATLLIAPTSQMGFGNTAWRSGNEHRVCNWDDRSRAECGVFGGCVVGISHQGRRGMIDIDGLWARYSVKVAEDGGALIRETFFEEVGGFLQRIGQSEWRKTDQLELASMRALVQCEAANERMRANAGTD